jgi:hypothetical protein
MPERGVDSSGGLHGSHRCQPELLNRESEGDIVQHISVFELTTLQTYLHLL